jgi:uncharacterized protein (DUF2236 family)
MVQALEPRAMAAVAQFSDFRHDPWGRLQRTADYVTATTFGDTATAVAAGELVRSIHERVHGVDPHSGRPYRADDPELLAWVHNVEVDSFLTAYRTYAGRLSAADADRYVAEMVRVAELVGLAPGAVPHDVAGLDAYLAAAPMDASAAAREALPLLVVPPPPDDVPGFRLVWSGLVMAAVAIMPARARRLYGLTWSPLLGPALRVAVGPFLRVARVAGPAAGRARSA